MLLKAAKFLLNLAAVGAAGATFVGWFGSQWWIFELFDHPRPQYCLILLLAIGVNAIKNNTRVWSLVLSLPLLLNLISIAPLFIPPAQSLHSDPLETPLRLLHVNLDRHNTNFTPTLEYLEKQDVDIIFLQEVTPAWLSKIKSDVHRYQVILSRPQDNSQGVAMLVPSSSPSVEVITTQIIHLSAFCWYCNYKTRAKTNNAVVTPNVFSCRGIEGQGL